MGHLAPRSHCPAAVWPLESPWAGLRCGARTPPQAMPSSCARPVFVSGSNKTEKQKAAQSSREHWVKGQAAWLSESQL